MMKSNIELRLNNNKKKHAQTFLIMLNFLKFLKIRLIFFLAKALN